MRTESNGTRYFGFDELAQKAFNLPPVSKTVKNENKRKEMEQKYAKYNTCKSCGKPLTYMGGNVATCINPECNKKGFKLLDSKSKNFAQLIFGEGGVTA